MTTTIVLVCGEAYRPMDSRHKWPLKPSLYVFFDVVLKKIWISSRRADGLKHHESHMTREPSYSIVMMTSSNGNIFRVTGHLCGELTGHWWIRPQRPAARSFDVFFNLRLNARLYKQSWCWWFETLSRPSWRHCNVFPFSCSLRSSQSAVVLSRIVCLRASNMS